VLTHFPFCVVNKAYQSEDQSYDYKDEDQTKDELPKVMAIDFFLN
jgi:hypothetical protein